jgi:HAD domain family 1 in Swiss Army Knife RNA repair proteins
MLASRNLNFDLVVLKPKLGRGVENSTLTFKYAFIDDVLQLGESIQDVEIYEDRASHRDAFENYLKNWRRIKEGDDEDEHIVGLESSELARQNGLTAFKVRFVSMPFIHLDEQVEESLVRTMVDETNKLDMVDHDTRYVLDKRTLGLAYAVQQDDFQRLFDTYFLLTTERVPSSKDEWRPLRQPSVFIHFNPAQHIVQKVGGIGKHVEFEVTHLGVSDKVIALSLRPTASFHHITDDHGERVLKPDSRLRFWSKNEIPVLVLATKDGGRPVDANYLQEWMGIPKSFENRRFMTKVTAKQEISIEKVSRTEAKARYVREQTASAEVARKIHTHPSPRMGRSVPSAGGRHYTGENTKRSTGSRNAFGYSLG